MSEAIAARDELRVSEKFVSLQGEGVSMGKPSAFVRLMMCNLACVYCDTPYTWDAGRFDLEKETRIHRFSELADWLLEHAPGRLIITGGEPLVQQNALVRFLPYLDERVESAGKSALFIEVETNGTVAPKNELKARVDQWNVSPKLAFSGEVAEKRIRPRAIAEFVETERAFFKFVVASESDVAEVNSFTGSFGLPPSRVLLMPEARSAEELRAKMGWVSRKALEGGLGYSHRLHLELYGGVRGT